ncbi:MAG: glycoside hydrolase family 38 C-terminal domain-containing protein, partial [Gemmatimonadaceae bacterium]
ARGAHDAWRPHLVLRNPAARPRGGVAVVDIAQFLTHVSVGPGSAPPGPPHARRAKPRLGGVAALQVLDREVRHERMESARAYPDDDLVEVTRAAVWVSELAGYGMRAHAVGGRRSAAAAVPNPVRVVGRTMDNGRLVVAVRDGGVVQVQDVATGKVISDVLAVEDQDDAGDLYTASPRGAVRGAQFVGARAVHRGPLRGTIEIRWRVVRRGGARVALRARLSLDADSDILRVVVHGENGAADHRLRLRLNTGVDGASVFADAAFGPVERVPLRLTAEEQMVEAAPPTAPLHRYVSLFNAPRGATVFSDGLAEYEADGAGAVRVTLVRAVGQLSRADLPERPGHAGWPTPTAEAQCLGPLGAELALLLHGPRDAAVIARIERAAEDVLTPVTGHTIRALLASPPESAGLSLDGEGLAFSCAKESEDGAWMVLRCVNLLERVVRGRWKVGFAIAEARMSRLDETPGDAVTARGSVVEFEAAPRGVVTLLVR